MVSKLVGLLPGVDEKEHHDGRRPRMTAADVVAKVMAGEHADFVREAVAMVARELMEAEISVEIGAELGEVRRGARDAPQRVSARGIGRRGSARSSC